MVHFTAAVYKEFDDVVVGALLEGPGNHLVLPVAKSPVDDALGGEQRGQRFAPSVDALIWWHNICVMMLRRV